MLVNSYFFSISDFAAPVLLLNSKGSVQAFRERVPYLNHEKLSKTERGKLLHNLYATITDLAIRQRSGRSEPGFLHGFVPTVMHRNAYP